MTIEEFTKKYKEMYNKEVIVTLSNGKTFTGIFGDIFEEDEDEKTNIIVGGCNIELDEIKEMKLST